MRIDGLSTFISGNWNTIRVQSCCLNDRADALPTITIEGILSNEESALNSLDSLGSTAKLLIEQQMARSTEMVQTIKRLESELAQYKALLE